MRNTKGINAVYLRAFLFKALTIGEKRVKKYGQLFLDIIAGKNPAVE